MTPNLSEIEEALKDRQWLTLDAQTLIAWILYTRELEGKLKPSTVLTQEGQSFGYGGMIFHIK